jgi:hypothetical protein
MGVSFYFYFFAIVMAWCAGCSYFAGVLRAAAFARRVESPCFCGGGANRERAGYSAVAFGWFS